MSLSRSFHVCFVGFSLIFFFSTGVLAHSLKSNSSASIGHTGLSNSVAHSQDADAVDKIKFVNATTDQAALDSAVTRDKSGNGYLDEIELYFSKPVSFPPGFSPSNITITYTVTVNGHAVAVQFVVDSIVPVDASGTKYVLYLAENSRSLPESPQTAWRPTVSIVGMEDPSSVPPTQCKDGAGPVIWSVTKIIENVSDRKLDVVQLIFSEPIQGPNGSLFSIASVAPGFVLFDYRKNADGIWNTIINMLDSINSFSRMVNDSTLQFTMSNGKDLTTNDYLNIKASANQIFDNRSQTTGGPGVPPVAGNQKVQVKVIANPRVIPRDGPVTPFVSTMQSGRALFIEYGGFAQDKVSVKIYSVKGLLVQSISGTEQGNGVIRWNYRDAFQRQVTNGCYIIRIFAGPENIKRKIFLLQ